MAHIVRLRKVGGSVMLAIPPAFLDALSLGPDASVGMSVEGGRLVVEPRRSPKFTLDELLAQCDPAAEDAASRDWLDAPAAGRELI